MITHTEIRTPTDEVIQPVMINGADFVPSDVPQAQAQALLAFFVGTGGQNWDNSANWGVDPEVKNWFGVDVEDNKVVGLSLPANGLSGDGYALSITTLTAVDVSGNTGLAATAVDNLLAGLNAAGASSGDCNIYNTAIPTAAGDAALKALHLRGWTFGPFMFEITTTEASQTFTLPLTSAGAYDCTVDWGDESTSEITAYDDADKAHEYATAGTYTIKISGTFKGFRFNNGGDKTLIGDIENWGCLALTNEAAAFSGCSNLTVSAFDAPDISLVTSGGFGSLFSGCASMTTCKMLDIVDTSNVTTATYMFVGCTNFNQSVSNLNTSNMAYLYGMFYGCVNFNQPVSNFDLSSASSIYRMFYQCTVFNQDLSGWDVSTITNMSMVFTSCTDFNQDISGWDTSSVTTMYQMFRNCSAFDQDLSGWDIETCTDMLLFLSGGQLSTDNYDALLIAWEAQTEQSGINVHFGGSKYTSGGAAETARTALIANGWTITDGGAA